MPSPALHDPVQLIGHLDPDVSRWQWLVKWFLAIPHFVVLAVLWPVAIVLTVIAAFAILFTGRYPRGIFDFNVGVLRWTWRVGFYATSTIATDRYPPFTFSDAPDYPARLDIAFPGSLHRGLVLVKWLLALPHLVIVGLIGGGFWWGWFRWGREGWWPTPGWVSGGLLGVLLLVVGIALLFTGRYPASLFDLVMGLNRWVYRVAAYCLLMTDVYPPFRLDQGADVPVARSPSN